jgi:chromosome segregation ATPase
VYPGYDEEAEDQYYFPPERDYPKGGDYQDENIVSERYNTKDYENVISTTYAKAKKYKRKAKKLYANLQKLKSHYAKAKRKIGKLEAENQRLTDQIVIFARRVDEVEDAYDRL